MQPPAGCNCFLTYMLFSSLPAAAPVLRSASIRPHPVAAKQPAHCPGGAQAATSSITATCCGPSPAGPMRALCASTWSSARWRRPTLSLGGLGRQPSNWRAWWSAASGRRGRSIRRLCACWLGARWGQCSKHGSPALPGGGVPHTPHMPAGGLSHVVHGRCPYEDWAECTVGCSSTSAGLSQRPPQVRGP